MSLPENELVTITMTEYHALQQDSLRMIAIRNVMDEFHMRRKVWRDGCHNGQSTLCALRGKTLSSISKILNPKWKGKSANL